MQIFTHMGNTGRKRPVSVVAVGLRESATMEEYTTLPASQEIYGNSWPRKTQFME